MVHETPDRTAQIMPLDRVFKKSCHFISERALKFTKVTQNLFPFLKRSPWRRSMAVGISRSNIVLI